jgi:uncharacterized membrane protein YraQ (UPF0718 family)
MENIIKPFKKPNRRILDTTASITSGIFRDKVFIGILFAILVLVFSDRPQIFQSLVFTADSLWQMLPFFLLAILFAAYATATNASSLIAQVFTGNPVKATILAAFIGALSPFCSCGVIPLIAAMLGAGVPLAPVMAFWIASPIMDPEMFILTAAGIGLNFAVAKTIAAVAMGLLAGFAVLFIRRYGFLASPLQIQVSNACATACGPDKMPALKWQFWQDADRKKMFFDETFQIARFLGKWLALAFFLESLMLAYVSSEWIVQYVGEDNIFAIPLAAIVGAPSYLNGYAAIPLISGLLEIGMTPGAAMAFITAGAVSSIPAAVAVFALVKKPVFALYILLGLVGSISTAWLYQLSGGVI